MLWQDERAKYSNEGNCMKGTAFNLFLSLYVDDKLFLSLETKEDMTKGASILYHHMKRFG
jgi:hypothetical protein